MSWIDNVIGWAVRRAEKAGYIDTRHRMNIGSFMMGEAGTVAPWQYYADREHEWLEVMALTNPVVYSNYTLLARACSQYDLEIQRRNPEQPEEWLPVVGHEFELTFERGPNPDYTWSEAWQYQSLWLDLRGEAFWMKGRNGYGQVKQLWPMPANRVVPIPNNDGSPRKYAGFTYTPTNGGSPRFIHRDEVIFHKLPNPVDYHRGMSPISPFATRLQLLREAENFDLDDYKNDLTLGKLISVAPDMRDSDFQRMVDDFRRSKEEGARYRIMRGGQFNVSDLQTRRGEEGQNVYALGEKYHGRIMGIPDGIRDSNATEANATVADRVFIRDAVGPRLSMWEQGLTNNLIVMEYGTDFRLRFTGVEVTDPDLELRQTESRRKAQTYNEARQSEGLTDDHPDPDVGNAPFDVAGQVYLAKMQSRFAVPQMMASMVKAQGEGKPFRFDFGSLRKLPTEAEIAALAEESINNFVELLDKQSPELADLIRADEYQNGRGEE